MVSLADTVSEFCVVLAHKYGLKYCEMYMKTHSVYVVYVGKLFHSEA